MRARDFDLRPAALAALLLCAFLPGCGFSLPGSSSVPEMVDDSAAANANATRRGAREPLELADSAPLELQLPKAVTDGVRGTIEPWVFAWRAGLGTCRLDQFERTQSRALPLDTIEPYDGNAVGEDLRLTYLAVPSPAVMSVADPYREWILDERLGVVHAARVGDPAVTLLDLKHHNRRTVLSLDGDGRIDGALWIDDHTLVVLAAERSIVGPEWKGGPVLYLMDLDRDSLVRYEGPAGDRETFRSVGEALERQFRKQRPEIAFDDSDARLAGDGP